MMNVVTKIVLMIMSPFIRMSHSIKREEKITLECLFYNANIPCERTASREPVSDPKHLGALVHSYAYFECPFPLPLPLLLLLFAYVTFDLYICNKWDATYKFDILITHVLTIMQSRNLSFH